jgi:hypothetical protein
VVTAGAGQRGRLSLLFPGLVLILVTAAAFLPSLWNDFTNWDDQVVILNNPVIRDLSVSNLLRFFWEIPQDVYKPLVLISYALEYRFFGLQPQVYHATNLLFHLLNVFLVFGLFSGLMRDRRVGFLTALLFAVHPMRVESVAWISARKDVLYGFFCLGACWVYLGYVRTLRWRLYGACFVLFLCSLFCKPMAVSFPFLLVVFDLFCGREISRRMLTEKIPFCIPAAVFGFFHMVILSKTGTIHHVVRGNAYLLYLTDVLVSYPLRLLWPAGLCAVYPFPKYPGHVLGNGLLSSPFLLPVLLVLFGMAAWKSRTARFGIGFFLVSLAPVIPYNPVGHALMADRYTYLPCLGLFVIFAEVLVSVFSRSDCGKWGKILLGVLLLIVAGSFSVMTWQRCKVWKNGLTLWNDVIGQYPDNALAYNNRADAHRNWGDFSPEERSRRVLADYNKHIELKPDFADAYFNRALEYIRRGFTDQAISDFRTVLKLNPKDAVAHYNLANAYSRWGRRELALQHYTEAVLINPHYADAYNNRGYEYFLMRRFKDAALDYRRALAEDSENSKAKANLKQLLVVCPECE